MKFSVLLSVYYKETASNLEQCFDSLACQTVPADQIVIVKDGKLTDELESVLVKWKEKLPLMIVGYEKNSGLSYALNYGLEYCAHELVARMDSDDICLKDRFEKQINYFELNQGVVLLSGYIQEFNDTVGDISSIRKVPLDCSEIARYIKWRNPFNHVAVMFKKEAVLSVGAYDTKVNYFEDYDLWIRLIQAKCQAANIPDILVYVRIGNNMIGRRHGLAYIKKEMCFLNLQRKRSFFSWRFFLILIVLRIPIRLVPQRILVWLYKLLRSKKA